MRKYLSIAILFAIVNLIPYLCMLMLLILNEGELLFNIVSAAKALFEMPTSLIWFIVQSDLGEVGWVLFNVILLGGSGYLVSR